MHFVVEVWHTYSEKRIQYIALFKKKFKAKPSYVHYYIVVGGIIDTVCHSLSISL